MKIFESRKLQKHTRDNERLAELLIHNFHTQSYEIVGKLESALLSRDYAGLISLAKRLEPAAIFMGAERLSKTLSVLKSVAEQADIDACEKALLDLRQHHKKLIHALQDYVLTQSDEIY